MLKHYKPLEDQWLLEIKRDLVLLSDFTVVEMFLFRTVAVENRNNFDI